jgi:cell wall-associated NlpC family hydrolase
MSRSSTRTWSGSRWAVVAIVALVVTATLPGVVAAEPAQSVGDLTARAKQVSDRLESLEVRSSQLDEQYNTTQLEIEQLQRQLAENTAEVEAARAALTDHRSTARRYAIDAYVSGGAVDEFLTPGDDNANLSRKRTYLSAVSGDRQQVIDDVSAAEGDLSDREAGLRAKAADIEAQRVALESSRGDLEATIDEQQALRASLEGQLAQAVTAERERREAEDASRARADAAAAQAAAERQAAARTATTLRAEAAARVAPTTTEAEDSDEPRDGDRDIPESTVAFPDPGNVPPGAAGAIAAARTQLGVPYRWGGASPGKGFDCSGLVMWAYGQVGRGLPHSSRALFSMSRRISAGQLQPGDLVFGGSPVHHVGMYVGDGMMIHAPHSGEVVKIASMYSTSKPVQFGRL